MALFDYLKQVQRFLRDGQQKLENPSDLIVYVNRARREMAGRAQILRILTPIGAPIQSIQITATGSGYTLPQVTITPPDAPSGGLPFPGGAQATALATAAAGHISDIEVQFGGDGYFQPTVTITDPTGTGATATATLAPYINQTAINQEIYKYSDINLSQFPGVAAIFAVKSVSIIYSNYRYSLPAYPLTIYQAMIRQYPRQYLYVPTMAGTDERGTAGQLYLYPIASQAYQMEWDCFCLPSDLLTDLDYEALPLPWTDAVPYFAAHLAFLELQNLNAAKFYLDLYDNMTHRFSAYARPGRANNVYGRY